MITRRDLAIAVASAMATTAVVTFAASPAKPIMHSTVFEWEGLKTEPTKAGSRRECFDARTATLDRFAAHVTTLNPGEAPHPAHRHPEEELMIVKEGTLEAVQNDKTHRVGPGGMIFEASNELHGLRNVGKTPAVYYVLKWIPPGMETKSAE
jgi:quercetin dioxygenase-like cupin family protein